MYTIKQAATRTGLTVPTIRAWERRYGVVAPARTAAGYRLYDDDAIERLSAMRSLVETEGWRPSQAAERVADPTFDLAPLVGPWQGVSLDRAGEQMAARTDALERAIDSFVAAARRVDVDAIERLLDEAFATQRFELAMEAVVFPALRRIGREWEIGELDVAAEHATSESVRRRLARFFDAVRPGDGRSQVLIGMPPGGHHDLGAFAFAVGCRRAGLDVLYLGANVPLESWVRMVRETSLPAVVIGAVTMADSSALGSVVEAIRSIRRPPTCFAGGPAAPDASARSRAIELPPSLDDAVAAIRTAVERAEGRSRRA